MNNMRERPGDIVGPPLNTVGRSGLRGAITRLPVQKASRRWLQKNMVLSRTRWRPKSMFEDHNDNVCVCLLRVCVCFHKRRGEKGGGGSVGGGAEAIRDYCY